MNCHNSNYLREPKEELFNVVRRIYIKKHWKGEDISGRRTTSDERLNLHPPERRNADSGTARESLTRERSVRGERSLAKFTRTPLLLRIRTPQFAAVCAALQPWRPCALSCALHCASPLSFFARDASCRPPMARLPW